MKKEERFFREKGRDVTEMKIINSQGQTFFEFTRELQELKVFKIKKSIFSTLKYVEIPKYLLFWNDLSIKDIKKKYKIVKYE